MPPASEAAMASPAAEEPDALTYLSYPTSPSLSNLTGAEFCGPAADHNAALQSLGRPHVDSFNFMLGDGLAMAIRDMEPVEFSVPETDHRVKLQMHECAIERPQLASNAVAEERRVFPAEARQRGTGYRGECKIVCRYGTF